METFEFEKEIADGFRVDDTQTFAQYAEYVLELKERNGIRPRTIDRYRDMLVRINDSFGAMKLTEIRPQHLNEFYKYLSEVGVRNSKGKATDCSCSSSWCISCSSFSSYTG